MNEYRRKSLIRQILESSLSELNSWRARTLPDQDIQTYIEILVHYLKREPNQLENVSRYVSLDEFPELYWLANLRKHLAAGTLRLEHVRHFLASVPRQGLWWPEVLFVSGMALSACAQASEAKQKFLEAEEALRKFGAVKKAAKARALREAIEAEVPESSSVEQGALPPVSNPPKLTLTKMEHNLLRCMSERPYSKFELAERLFGRADFRIAEARIEELLAGITRKHPELIRKEKARFVACTAPALRQSS